MRLGRRRREVGRVGNTRSPGGAAPGFLRISGSGVGWSTVVSVVASCGGGRQGMERWILQIFLETSVRLVWFLGFFGQKVSVKLPLFRISVLVQWWGSQPASCSLGGWTVGFPFCKLFGNTNKAFFFFFCFAEINKAV